MRKITARLMLAAILLATSGAFIVAISAEVWYSRVTAIDGDTLRVPGVGSVRVLYMDAPESRHRARCPVERELAEQATLRVQYLILPGIRLVREGRPIDRYGRPLRIVFLRDGRRLDHVLIEENLAVDYRGRGPRMDWCQPR